MNESPQVTRQSATERLLSRKWLVTIFLLIAPLVLRCIDRMTEGGLVTIWTLVAAAYFGANVAQKLTLKSDAKKE